jgi:5-methylthioadenosine/S-adenosylhomocysteine deaminase
MALFREETRLRAQRIVEAAPRRLLLRGRIATLDSSGRVIADGFVCIADDLIASVSPADAGIPTAFQGSPLIQTGGTIYPGLIELHNHPAYNAIPLWSVPTWRTSRCKVPSRLSRRPRSICQT